MNLSRARLASARPARRRPTPRRRRTRRRWSGCTRSSATSTTTRANASQCKLRPGTRQQCWTRCCRPAGRCSSTCRRQALLELAKECGDVVGQRVDALTDEEAAFVQRRMLMVLHILDHDVARAWIERLREPNAATLDELHALLRTRRPHRLRWVDFIAQRSVGRCACGCSCRRARPARRRSRRAARDDGATAAVPGER